MWRPDTFVVDHCRIFFWLDCFSAAVTILVYQKAVNLSQDKWPKTKMKVLHFLFNYVETILLYRKILIWLSKTHFLQITETEWEDCKRESQTVSQAAEAWRREHEVQYHDTPCEKQCGTLVCMCVSACVYCMRCRTLWILCSCPRLHWITTIKHFLSKNTWVDKESLQYSIWMFHIRTQNISTLLLRAPVETNLHLIY